LLIYELDDDLKPTKHYYLGDADEIAIAAAAVAARGRQSRNYGFIFYAKIIFRRIK